MRHRELKAVFSQYLRPIGEGDDDDDKAGKPARKSAEQVEREIREKLEGKSTEKLLAEIVKLYGQNYDLRADKRELTAKLTEVEGVVKTYEPFGKPDELKKQLEAMPELQKKLDALNEAQTFGEAAKLANFKPEAFEQIARGFGLKIEISDVPTAGKDDKGNAIVTQVKTPVVKLADGSTQPLSSYLETHHAPILPALRGDTGKPAIVTSGKNGIPQGGTGGNATQAKGDAGSGEERKPAAVLAKLTSQFKGPSTAPKE